MAWSCNVVGMKDGVWPNQIGLGLSCTYNASTTMENYLEAMGWRYASLVGEYRRRRRRPSGDAEPDIEAPHP